MGFHLSCAALLSLKISSWLDWCRLPTIAERQALWLVSPSRPLSPSSFLFLSPSSFLSLSLFFIWCSLSLSIHIYLHSSIFVSMSSLDCHLYRVQSTASLSRSALFSRLRFIYMLNFVPNVQHMSRSTLPQVPLYLLCLMTVSLLMATSKPLFLFTALSLTLTFLFCLPPFLCRSSAPLW